MQTAFREHLITSSYTCISFVSSPLLLIFTIKEKTTTLTVNSGILETKWPGRFVFHRVGRGCPAAPWTEGPRDEGTMSPKPLRPSSGLLCVVKRETGRWKVFLPSFWDRRQEPPPALPAESPTGRNMLGLEFCPSALLPAPQKPEPGRHQGGTS